MKTLYLVRHGKAAPLAPPLDDRDRPLTEQGQADVSRMAQHLADRGVSPHALITSTALRARQTAETIATTLGYPTENIQNVEACYLAECFDLLDVVQGMEDPWETVILVGHNPTLTELTNYLTGDTLGGLSAGACAAIRFHEDAWSSVAKGQGELAYLDEPPKDPNA